MNVAFSNIGNPIQLNSASTCLVNSSLKEKLHFTTLNYVLNYTLHLKLLECTVITLNYSPCYTLQFAPVVDSAVILNGINKNN